METEPRRTAAGRGKERASIGQEADIARKGTRSEASTNGFVPGRKKGAVGKENWWGHFHRWWWWEGNASCLLLRNVWRNWCSAVQRDLLTYGSPYMIAVVSKLETFWPRLPKTGNSQDCWRLQPQSSLWSLTISEISRLTKDQFNQSYYVCSGYWNFFSVA